MGGRGSVISITRCASCGAVKLGPWYLRLPGTSMIHGGSRIHLPLLPTVAVASTHSTCPKCATRLNEQARAWWMLREIERP